MYYESIFVVSTFWIYVLINNFKFINTQRVYYVIQGMYLSLPFIFCAHTQTTYSMYTTLIYLCSILFYVMFSILWIRFDSNLFTRSISYKTARYNTIVLVVGIIVISILWNTIRKKTEYKQPLIRYIRRHFDRVRNVFYGLTK